MKKCTNSWRKMLLDHLPADIHNSIKKTNEGKMRKIMDMMKVRIHFYKDMNQHKYFFEEPDYADKESQKFLQRLKQANEVKIKILSDLCSLFKEISPDQFSIE